VWSGALVVSVNVTNYCMFHFVEHNYELEVSFHLCLFQQASSKSGSSGVPPQAPYYMTLSYPPGGTQGAPGASNTLPRGGQLHRAYSPAVASQVPADRIKSLPQTGKHQNLIFLSPGLVFEL
jgi:hypothetical protein